MTAESALARLHAKIDEAETIQQSAAYCLTALAILGTSAPDVLEFILDRADDREAAGL
jgi:hypothetical protein